MSHEQFQSCIEACNDCATACDHCASACLSEADVKKMARCIALDVDCAEICRVASAYMGRSSELAGIVCDACAEICEACAAECEKHDMQHCKQCAEACRRCAEECRRMVGARTGGKKGTTQHAAH
jgi:hypothetical protein